MAQAAGRVREVRRWSRELDLAAGRVEARFGRPELKRHAGRFLAGLIGI